ncbi:MAG: potassium/proton antiporter [Actinomycetota bacterium]|nr:potassium/proton antiporter [Actinomycetota bacterium]
MDEHLNLLLLLGCGLLLVAVLAVRLADRTGLPSLLVYLALGVLVGEAGLGIEFEDYDLTADLGLIALAVILAEGGLTTRWAVVRPALPFATVLATVGVGVSVAVVAGVAHLLLGVDLQTAVVLGGVLASTDAAAVFSVLRRLPLAPWVRSTLEAESGLNDAPAVVVVVLASSDAFGETGLLDVLLVVGVELVGGALLGVAVGRLGRLLLSRAALPSAGLYPLATVGLVLVAFTAANALHASGFLAAYVAGLAFGNGPLPHRRAVLGFAGSLSLLAEVGLFVLLGLLVSPDRLPEAVGLALLVGAASTFLARPLAVAVSAAPFRLPLREQLFLSWAGLRGAVPIVLATIPVTAGVDGAERVVDVVFVLVVVYTLVQAPTLPFVGRRLGVVERGQALDLEVETAPLEEMGADLLQLRIPPGSRLHGVYVEELRLPPGAQLTLVVRDGQSLVPGPTTQLAVGDQLLVVATTAVRDAAEARLKAVARAGKLARWYGDGQPPR